MATMPERMAVQETLMVEVRTDVKDIKADVRSLLAAARRAEGRNAIFRAVPWAALITAVAAILVK